MALLDRVVDQEVGKLKVMLRTQKDRGCINQLELEVWETALDGVARVIKQPSRDVDPMAHLNAVSDLSDAIEAYEGF